MKRIIVATGNPFTAKKIEDQLDITKIEVVSFTLETEQLLEELNAHKPDLCLIDYELLESRSDYTTILSIYRIPILMISSQIDQDHIYDNHPLLNIIEQEHIDTLYLHNLINYMIKVSQHIETLEVEQMNLKKEVQSIKLLNEAKRLLMRYEGYSEMQAHKYMINKSMQKRISREKFSENVINKYKSFS
ncbi:ANTAR domain-containing response regulator [Haloplasma contractile]|uniref:Chemotaxis response regulator protein-glutamate methylesterase n=1 Tax=Haloplasma contractile SSD-17B TaxID=1033810 RepID=F7PT08_9MOLU|nr:ANTAR domain-containing protein [Haloplasma contractile]ERJ12580.1 Chemotaxis response regulator protein-glutamate methylesterase [Haloplasma contractile SSD-17B]